MRSAIADKRDFLAVRRPLRLRISAANVRKLSRRFFAGDGRDPQLVRSGPHREPAIRRNLNVFATLEAAIHVAQQARLTAGDIRSPHLLLWLLHIAGGVGHFALVVGLASSRIDDRAAIGS